MNKNTFPLDKFFKALADEIRLRIMRILLKGPFHVNEILFITGLKQSNISHHLKILSEGRVVSKKKEGSLIYYQLNNLLEQNGMRHIINLIQSQQEYIINYRDDTARLQAVLDKRKKQAEDFFNSVGGDLDQIQAELFQDIYSINEAVQLLKQPLNTIIDIGCGTGRNLPILAEYANKVIGIDLSPKMLQLSEHICQKNHLSYELKQGDLQHIPVESDSIDGIFMNMVLHHSSEPYKVLQEVYRIMITKGNLLLIDLLKHNDEVMREKYADIWLGFSLEEIKNWLDKLGFVIKKEIIKGKDSKHPVIIMLMIKK
jgi:ArsR family transcriptional regulator